MATEAEPKLAGVFPPATEQQWLELVDKVLKGAPLTRLHSTTPDGIDVAPLYTRATSPGGSDEAGFPGHAPFTRGADDQPRDDGAWGVRVLVDSADPAEANRLALRELERGATSLTVRTSGGDDLDRVLQGVLLDVAPIHLRAGAGFRRAADQLVALWDRLGLGPDAVAGSFGADPIGVLASTGVLPQGLDAALGEVGELAATTADRPQVRVAVVDTAPYVEAGAGEAQELALMLSTGVAYLRALSDAGLSADQACAQIEVSLGADADVFTTIAKLRAARRVWSAMCAACGASDQASAMRLHVRTADRMMTRRDPWVNLLRVTAAAFAAGVGGADEVTTAPFDAELGEPDELGRRMARNTQLLLQEEANVGRVIDPAGGSWYVETLTEQLAQEAWALFGEIETAGGIAAGVVDGSVARRIAEVRDSRLLAVAKRTQPVTGVSEFPDIAEAPVRRPPRDVVGAAAAPADGTTATRCEPLRTVRWSEEYEALRDASDAHLAATGARPQVFLVNLGPVATHTARASFAKNFFEAGGIEAITSERGSTTGYDDPAQAAADVSSHGAALVCLCSSDGRYAEHAEEFARALRAVDGVRHLYLAGNPGDRRDAETSAGVTEFVHIGVDVLDVLRRAHQTLGTPATATATTTESAR